MTHADYHPCSEGCGRDSELPGPCEECDMRRRIAARAIESLSDSPAARAAGHEDHQRLIRQMLSQRSEDRAQLRIARAELSFLGSQLKRVQALLVVDGNADEAAAALHDLLTTPGDASLLLASKAVDRTGGEDDCA